MIILSTPARAQEALMAGPVVLPPDVRAIPDQPGVALGGAWTGLTSDGIPVVLTIEAAGPGGTVGVMLARAGGTPARAVARRQADVIRFRADDIAWTARRSDSGDLILTGADGFATAVLSPAALDQITDPAWVDDFHGAQVVALPGPADGDGAPTALVTLLYAPNGPGPHPLAVLHHGATDSGTDPAAFARVWTHRPLAEMLRQRGYLVAVPQRRGRGGSTGRYGEGLAPRGRGYSCDPGPAFAGWARAMQDLDAIVAALYDRPDVAQAPALHIGNSRGGALALSWAGAHPSRVSGVVSFVGGWVEQGCPEAAFINHQTLRAASGFAGPTLWLYGQGDTVYDADHTRALFDGFVARGGTGIHHLADIPWDGGGHQLISIMPAYRMVLEQFLDTLAQASRI